MTWLSFGGGEGGLVNALSGRGAGPVDDWMGARRGDGGGWKVACLGGLGDRIDWARGAGAPLTDAAWMEGAG